MDRRVTSPPWGPLPPCNQAIGLCILYCIIKGGHIPGVGASQVPWARVTAFSRTSLFLERFWREF